MTEFVFPSGGVWQFGSTVTTTPNGCYPHVVQHAETLTEDSARAILAAAPRRRLNDPDVEREVAARVGCAGEPVLGYEW